MIASKRPAQAKTRSLEGALAPGVLGLIHAFVGQSDPETFATKLETVQRALCTAGKGCTINVNCLALNCEILLLLERDCMLWYPPDLHTSSLYTLASRQ